MSSDHVGPLVRRSMKKDEWWDSYFFDVVRAHGVAQPNRRDADSMRRLFPWRQMPDSGKPADDRVERSAPSGFPFNNLEAVVPTWAAFSTFTPIQYCPHCLIEDRYLRARWRLSSLRICLVHGCLLKRDMQIPHFTRINMQGNLLSYWDASNTDLLKDIEYCSAAELKAFSSVWGEADKTLREGVTSGVCREEVEKRVAWAIVTWAALEQLMRSDCFDLDRRSELGIRPTHSIAKFVEQSNLQVCASFDGIKGMHQALGQGVSCFGTSLTLRKIFEKEQKSTSLVSRLRIDLLLREIEIAVSQDESWSFFDDRGRGGKLEGMKLKEIASLLAVSEPEVLAFICKSALVDVCRTRLGPYFRVPHKHVKNALRWRAKQADLDELQKTHGLDLEAALSLLKSGLLQTERYEWWQLIKTSSLSGLVSKLELHCAPMHESAGLELCGLFSPKAREVAGRSLGFVDLVSAVIQGELPLFRSLEKPGLSSFFVTEKALLGLRRRQVQTFAAHTPLRSDAVDRTLSTVGS